MTSLDRGPSARDVTGGKVADFAAYLAAGMDADVASNGGADKGADCAAAVQDNGLWVPSDDAPPPLPRSVLRPPGYTPRRSAGLCGYERVLARAGFTPVAGVDEAGRGACAGPLVVAAVVFGAAGPPVPRLADSKALTPAVREQVYREVVAHALSWHVVVIPPAEIDRLGLHVCNIVGMRRALAGISCRPGYVLTDGFPVSGLTVPALAMWKGDQVAACVAAASVVAKVTRDRIMMNLHDRYPAYDFAEHKGYSTRRHSRALVQRGPCPEHRLSFVNVLSASHGRDEVHGLMPDNGEMADAAPSMDGAGISAAHVDGAGAAAVPAAGAAVLAAGAAVLAAGGAVTRAGYTAGADWAAEAARDS